MPDRLPADLPPGVWIGTTGPGPEDWVTVFAPRPDGLTLWLFLPADSEFTLVASLPQGARLDPPVDPPPAAPRSPCDGK